MRNRVFYFDNDDMAIILQRNGNTHFRIHIYTLYYVYCIFDIKY